MNYSDKAREAAEDFFYCEPDEDGNREIWEPFENLSEAALEELIDSLAYSFATFPVNGQVAIRRLYAQAMDAAGVIDEFVAMPCQSLQDKFPTTSVRLRNALKTAKPYIMEQN